jgi:hypothetical protein
MGVTMNQAGVRRLTAVIAVALSSTMVATGLAVLPTQAHAESLGTQIQVAPGSKASGKPASGTPTAPAAAAAAGRTTRTKAVAMYGTPRSGLPWHSGFWTGVTMSSSRTAQAERWAGRPFDFVTVYPAYGSWAEMADSAWTATLMRGYRGRLAYGLPLLPNNRRGQWQDVLSGRNDQVFRKIARDLRVNGRGDAAVRVGLEANGDWFAWGATASTADEFRAAFRRVVKIMNAESPQLTFWFDISAGYGLPGQRNRMDALNLLYPGDAYVDGISIDHYDFWGLKATSNARWATALKPSRGPGLADAAAFARKHRKGFGVPEWGVHGTEGAGDNPFFIKKMHEFFMANRDVLVFECYFNEPDPYIRNAIFSPVQMPKSSAAYRAYF